MVNLRNLLKDLGKKQVTSVLCEGGGELAGSLIESGLVDKIMFFIAPKIIGGRAAKSPVEGEGIKYMADAIKLKDMTVKRIGDDILVEAYVHRNN
jgi:diaminohydroxyphosphoribosylaminopyrimidine deaminase/5-amino-6-(5-phosphoribosylamino)uracil reductase